MKKTCRGFTLVELSIVLVIVGLIIGGVLTGQQIIQNARITNAVNGIQAYQGQFQTYAQNYGAIPGDDASATTRFPSANLGGGTAGGGNGNGDGSVGTGNSFDTTSFTVPEGESRLVWAHLRAAGLVKSQSAGGSTAVQPQNPFGGVYGFQNGAFSGVFTTTALCLNKVPSGAAQAIDSRLDDGASNAGSVQAAVDTGAGSSSGTVSEAYSDGKAYTLCIKM